MSQVEEQLVRRDDGLIRLFTPAFDKSTRDPGYIKGYLPGVRENGGQYTHGAVWSAWAFALLGDGDRAHELYELLSPVRHATTPEAVWRYKVEPYVIAADVYSVEPHVGRGGWTWYTGSASWYYRLAVEGILGIQKCGGELRFRPCLPSTWPGYRASWRHGATTYDIEVRVGSDRTAAAPQRLRLDGEVIDGAAVLLRDDGVHHEVVVEIG
jgi:cyclic beta-1,2-glucan synthetase